jgi:23S rRNA pseudouridine1911/1915/1917 synthase
MAMSLPPELRQSGFVVDDASAGERLDALLERRIALARRETRRMVSEGRIRVDGRALLRGSPRLGRGSLVEILRPEARPEFLSESIPLLVLLENDDLLLVDKPGGMAVYPGPGHPAGTLANALRGLGRPLSSVEGSWRPGIVHRLDAGTSGVMVVAKTDAMHHRLCCLFREHAVIRRYVALVVGEPAWEERVVDGPLGRRRRGRRAFAVRGDGRPAETHLRVVGRAAGFALLEATPETGRTHQIRVHLAWLGHAVCGDTLYGGGDRAARQAARLGLRRPALHALSLAIPATGHGATAALPSDMGTAMAVLGLGAV